MELIKKIDMAILLFINHSTKNSFFDIIMPFITSLNNSGEIWIVIAIFVLLNKNNRKYGWRILFALILSVIIGNMILKPLVRRIRPFDVYSAITLIINKPLDFSFPSAHTMSSFAAATVLFFMNKKIGIFSFILAFLIAFSRLYLFVHYPTDISAGIIIGILIGIFSSKIKPLKNKI